MKQASILLNLLLGENETLASILLNLLLGDSETSFRLIKSIVG